jgi:sterol desaturase/sphingolipid hydroxylase (fatty acid hydroxylase superfamily)
LTSLAPFSSSSKSIGLILAAMAIVASIEAAAPLRPRGRWNRAHLVPNLSLTGIAFATNLLLDGGLLVLLAWLSAKGFGLLPLLALSPSAGVAAAVLALDFATYAAHVALHKVPLFWRFHRVHHSDPAVDVTTTVRQHPGESLVRAAFLLAFAVALGASPAGFAAYRAWSALNALLEHANLRVPVRLDALLSFLVTTPNMHKVHHSRSPEETDTNYGNIFALFDRLFRTFTPSERGVRVAYGLDGFDGAAAQTTAGLLWMPFSERPAPAARLSAAHTT